MTIAADPRSFLYRELDADQAGRLTAEALAKADDGELYLQYRRTEAFGFDDGRLKTAAYDTSSGFGLRAVSGEMTAFAHANEITPEAIRRAGETMALIDPSATPKAAPPQGTNRHLYTDTDPLDLVPFADKVNLCQAIDAAARARDPRVAQVSVSLSGSWSVVEIVRADGFVATDVRPLVRLNVSIVAESNGRRETGSFGIGGRYLYDGLFEPATWNRAIDEALAQALVNLEAVDAPAGEMTVLLGPGWPGVLLHEAIGHGLEGDFNRKGTSAFSGRIGERVAAPGVTIVDDGSLPDRRGSLSIDDEGTPTREVVLIEDGILKGYMQDRLNARLRGVPATGNGRRESFAHAPMPRMTNTFM
jgi:TldD protein